jgi:hypothetical protein
MGHCVTGDREGDACEADSCVRGLACASDPVGGPTTCQLCPEIEIDYGDEGAVCGLALPCRPDLACIGDERGASPTCQPPIPAGGACTLSARCAEPDERCDATFGVPGRCRRIGAAGDPCSADFPYCGADLSCRLYSSGTCEPVYGPGEPCDDREDCWTGECTAGVCVWPCA